MSCILRRDVSGSLTIPMSRLDISASLSMSMPPTTVQSAGAEKHITETIAEYSGKKDLDLALLHLTNNAVRKPEAVQTC